MLNEVQAARFCQARRAFIAGEFQHLNPEQQKGVMATEGPLLLLAGAGSGKTTVLINRVANLIKYGRGSDPQENDVPDWVTPDDLAALEGFLAAPVEGERPRMEQLCRLDPAAPWSILAITFTNKAAGELKERLERKLGPSANDIWAATFHSACVRILRRDIEPLGFSRSFTIYDTDDAKRVIKGILKDRNLDEKSYPPRTVMNYISRAKDRMLLAEDWLRECQQEGDLRLIQMAKIYVDYEKRLKDADALDFDDLIFHTVRLLLTQGEVRSYWQNKFRYVLIDEYQDTNHLQYLLASTLAGKWENICVVGDDDQSIYRFRGATIENILSFEEQYSGARVIRLEQNYRSTQNILSAANAVIHNNRGRKGKELWTDAGAGEKLRLYTASSESDEAQYVAAQILTGYSQGMSWRDFAVLYRMNAQSNALEYAFKRNGIPYKVYGGIRFFDRAEVKDMLAYLCVLHNPADDLRLRRIINNPPRGIGAKTVDTAADIAASEGCPIYEVLRNARNWPELAKSAGKLDSFLSMMEELREKANTMELPEFYEEVLSATGYAIALEAKGSIESESKLENVRELGSSVQSYVDNAEEPSLAGFLDEVALYTDLDSAQDSDNCAVMMTMHAAKGLEFPWVFVVGMEEGLFPGMRVIGEPEEMEEERRLCYVAMTRAKERLYLTCASHRMLYGRTSSNRPSRFTGEIPDELLEKSGRRYDEDYREYGGQWGDSDGQPSGERPVRTQGGYGYGRARRTPAYQLREGRMGGGSSIGQTRVGNKVSKSDLIQSVNLLSQYKKGEMVEHTAFGRGMIVSVTPMGGDALVEIAFDNVGTKRLMLRSAAQHMKKA
ncbi:MAG: UvrD-helicase domain-containing protein [Clostridiales bacterium]|nr:UvrD-helicase domain-containing protein [Clostridiales bacterium]